MGASPSLGFAVRSNQADEATTTGRTRSRGCLGWWRIVLVCAGFVGAFDARVLAADRYALIITGAAGRPEYAIRYQSWRNSLAMLLRVSFGYPDDHVVVLAEEENRQTRKPTRENVRKALADLQRRAVAGDVVLVLLMGHGTSGTGANASNDDDAKFNLVGPDLSADEWAAAIKPIAGRLVFVNSASGSFPFLQKLSGPGRIVISATGSTMQEYETIFPEFFVHAFGDTAADGDKNGRVSIWEAFAYASAAVKQWFDVRGQLPTERALLDDTADGLGREADEPTGADGAIARVTYLQPDTPIAAPADSESGMLLRRRADIQAQIDLLRARKPNLPDSEYQTELERLLVELARLDRDIRAKQ